MQYHRILLAAGMLLMAACTDDPVVPRAEHTEQPAPRITAQQQQTDNGISAEKYQSRLDVDFEVTGELAPGTPITVHIEAVAVADISGGEVQVRLPTFNAMANGVVPGGKAPVVKSWTLPKMERGEQWKQIVDIGEIDKKGYYKITAFAETDGGYKSAYVFDDVLHEAWLYVIDGGGFVTRVFDESVFPSEIVPQPGPFEAWIKGSASAAAATGVTTAATAAASASTFKLYAYTEDRFGNNVGMEGAQLRVDYYERGQLISTWARTVPSSGILNVPCVGYAEQVGWGSVKNPTTSDINGGHRLASFQVRYSDCTSRTKDVEGARQLYLPWSYLDDDAIDLIEDHFGYNRSRISFRFHEFDEDDETPPASYYDADDDEIVFRGHYDRPWVAAHEFTHGLHEEELGGIWDTSNCNPHYTDSVSSYSCAMSEGLADYGGDIGSPDDRFGWETWFKVKRDDGAPAEIEGNVAAALWDLIDENNEGDDETSLEADDVMTVIRTCRTPSSQMNSVPDFIWCLEGEVDDDAHDDHFPGISAPSSVRVTRPSNWDEDDIRSTWLKSMGNN